MRYFEGLTQENLIKARYKDLAKQHHPDVGGDKASMQEINTQYEQVLRGHYQAAGKSMPEIDDLLEKDHALREKLCCIAGIVDLVIEICGSWIWITGNTRAHADTLKKNNFLWAPKKKAWYWRAEAKRRYSKNTLSMDQIRDRHGSLSVNGNKFRKTALA
jgi:curved DNA-binding protein CbpA